VATCFDQLRGRPQATRAHKTKITNENVILSQNERSFCYRVHVDTVFSLSSKALVYNWSLLLATVFGSSAVCLVCRCVMAGRIYVVVSWQEGCVAF